jgi:hypothetical protein
MWRWKVSNLKLWDTVKKTDPEHTKTVSQRGGYTSISPQYQIRCATEAFGIYGSGWGFESIDLDMSIAESMSLVLVKAVFFYVYDGKRSTFPINNSWPIKSGTRIDNDFAKKAETNTMSKALSKLGFSADVFMGEFDNPDYVQAVGNEFALENAEDKIEEVTRQQVEHQEWVDSVKQTLSTAVTQNELKGVFTGAIRKAGLRKDATAIRQFTDIKDKRKAELEK